MKYGLLVTILGLLALGTAIVPIQGDLIQCVVDPCNGTIRDDFINGTANGEEINGDEGDDVIFAGDGIDDPDGDAGDDMIFGGPGDDDPDGRDGNDILSAGPDGPPLFQQAIGGGQGNDSALVLVSETTGCLVIQLGPGNDTVNLIGFGPFSAQRPFGQPGFGNGVYVHVVDPVAGGDIFIEVSEDDDIGAETINGLLSPNVTIVPVFDELNCND